MNRRAVLLLIASVAAAATGKLRGAGPGEVGHAAAEHEHKGPLRSLAALVDPAAQEARKKQHLEAFKKLQAMSLQDLQVEFIVCIRAEHYKDALMYSEIPDRKSVV